MCETQASGLSLPDHTLDRVLTSLPDAFALPAEAYTAPDIFAFEQDMLERHGWVCVGRADEVAELGAQRAVEVAGEGLLIVRNADDVAVFVNACRHRGHELVQRGCSVKRATVWCAYHAWVYRLDGTLRTAPRFGNLAERDPLGMGLTCVRSEEWGGFLFVNLSGDAPALSTVVGNLEELLQPYELAGLTRTARHEYDVAANWKLLVENYLECYHCPSTHPELSKVQRTVHGMDFEESGLWLGGFLDLDNKACSMSLDGSGPAWTFPGLDMDRARQVCYHVLLPGLFITAMHDYVVTHRLEPQAPDRTRVVCEVLFSHDLLAKDTDPAYASDFWHVTNQQDWRACTSVQRGMTRSHYRPGPLAIQEEGLHRFLGTMASVYRGRRPLRSLWRAPVTAPACSPVAPPAANVLPRKAR